MLWKDLREVLVEAQLTRDGVRHILGVAGDHRHANAHLLQALDGFSRFRTNHVRLDLAVDPAYRLLVDGQVGRPLALSLDELQAMPQHTVALPISCVEGWSATATWTGVRVRDLLAEADAHGADRTVDVESLQPQGRYRRSQLNPSHASDADTILALEIDGEPLHIDHGFPVRLLGPNRPGVLQTKWVSKLVVH